MFSRGGFLADDGKFLFGTLLGVDFSDTHLPGQIADLRLAISRHIITREVCFGPRWFTKERLSARGASRKRKVAAYDCRSRRRTRATGDGRKLIRAGTFRVMSLLRLVICSRWPETFRGVPGPAVR